MVCRPPGIAGGRPHDDAPLGEFGEKFRPGGIVTVGHAEKERRRGVRRACADEGTYRSEGASGHHDHGGGRLRQRAKTGATGRAKKDFIGFREGDPGGAAGAHEELGLGGTWRVCEDEVGRSLGGSDPRRLHNDKLPMMFMGFRELLRPGEAHREETIASGAAVGATKRNRRHEVRSCRRRSARQTSASPPVQARRCVQ